MHTFFYSLLLIGTTYVKNNANPHHNHHNHLFCAAQLATLLVGHLASYMEEFNETKYRQLKECAYDKVMVSCRRDRGSHC